MRLTINLATRPYYNQRLVVALLLAVAVLLLALTVIGGTRLLKSRDELQRLDREIARFDTRLLMLRNDPRKVGVEAARKRAVVLDRLEARQAGSPSWFDMLHSLETQVPSGVSLTRLESGAKGEVTIEGRTRNFAEVQKLLESLDRSSLLRDNTLISHTSQLHPELGTLVQFTVHAQMVAP